MEVYVYCADIYCADCGGGIKADLSGSALDDGDSNSYPQGPYGDGGGEADCPQHCGACSLFLENPLTPDGYNYVREALLGHTETGRGAADVLNVWRDYYELSRVLFFDDLREEFKIDFSMKYDSWGHTMGAFFDLAGEMYHRGLDIPEDWQYRPSPMSGDIREHDSGFFEPCAMATDSALLELGILLHRLCDYLRREGHSY